METALLFMGDRPFFHMQGKHHPSSTDLFQRGSAKERRRKRRRNKGKEGRRGKKKTYGFF